MRTAKIICLCLVFVFVLGASLANAYVYDLTYGHAYECDCLPADFDPPLLGSAQDQITLVTTGEDAPYINFLSFHDEGSEPWVTASVYTRDPGLPQGPTTVDWTCRVNARSDPPGGAGITAMKIWSRYDDFGHHRYHCYIDLDGIRNYEEELVYPMDLTDGWHDYRMTVLNSGEPAQLYIDGEFACTVDGVYYISPQNTINFGDLAGPMAGDADWKFVGWAQESAPWAGDANRDNYVDETDAMILASNWMMSSGATWDDGDFDGDEDVDNDDLIILTSNMGWNVWDAFEEPIPEEPPIPEAAVPEPSSLILLLGLTLITFVLKRKR